MKKPRSCGGTAAPLTRRAPPLIFSPPSSPLLKRHTRVACNNHHPPSHGHIGVEKVDTEKKKTQAGSPLPPSSIIHHPPRPACLQPRRRPCPLSRRGYLFFDLGVVPLPVAQRAGRPGLEPALDAVQVEDVAAVAPRDRLARVVRVARRVGLVLDGRLVQVVAADGARVGADGPGPHGDRVPLFHLEAGARGGGGGRAAAAAGLGLALGVGGSGRGRAGLDFHGVAHCVRVGVLES